VSTHDLPAVADRVIECKLDVLQTLYCFASPATYGPAIEKLHQAGVGTVAMKVMAKTAPARQPGPAGERAKAPNFAPAALKWVLRNPSIDTTVPSMTDTDQLEQNFKVMAEKFTDADAKLLTARLEEITPYFCRMCGECKGQCPKGLPVADMVRFRHVRGRLRPVWLGPGELPADGRRPPGSAVRRLRDLRGPMPAWRPGVTEVDARPGVVRVILGQHGKRRCQRALAAAGRV